MQIQLVTSRSRKIVTPLLPSGYATGDRYQRKSNKRKYYISIDTDKNTISIQLKIDQFKRFDRKKEKCVLKIIIK